MSIEAMKLALEALENWVEYFPQNVDDIDKKAITSLREALAKPDFWEGYVPEPVKPAQQLVDCHATGVCVQSGLRAEQPAQQDSTCSNALRAQGKAYPRTCKKCGLGPCVELAQQALDKKAENARELGLDYEPAQKPVAWTSWRELAGARHYRTPGWEMYADKRNPDDVALYTSPPAQRTWVGLFWGELPEDGQNHDFLRGAVWAETKLKEKNT